MAKDGRQWTVQRLLDWTKEHFAKAGVQSPRLSAEILLADAMGCPRIELYTRYAQQPGSEVLDAFRAHVRRAANHEPVAYLVGHKEFYSLDFRVTPDVLIPRPETEMLVSAALDFLREASGPARLWDICTGCGCVAIAAANQRADLQVLATDICSEAVAVAAENAERLGVADRVRCRQADLLELPEDCADLTPPDVITANPPYVGEGDEVAEVVRHEPDIALYAGKDPLSFLRRIVADAPGRLRDGGSLILEFGYGQADELRDLICADGRYGEPEIHQDYQGLERMCLAMVSPA